MRTVNLLDIARRQRPAERRSIRSSRAQFQTVNGTLGQRHRHVVADQPAPDTFSFIIRRRRTSTSTRRPRRLPGDAEPRDPRRAQPAVARSADATRSIRACRRSTTGSRRPTTSSRPAPTGRCGRTCSIRSASARRATTRSSIPATRSTSTTRQGGYRIDLPLMDDAANPSADQLPIPRNNPVWNITNTLTWLKGKHTVHLRRHVPPDDDVRVDRRRAAVDHRRHRHRRSGVERLHRDHHPRPAHRTIWRQRAVALRAARRAASAPPAARYFLDENTKQYGLNPAFRREAQNVGGFYAQDQWRISPTADAQLRPALGVQRRRARTPTTSTAAPTLGGSVRAVDGALPAGRAQRRRRIRRSTCSRSPYKARLQQPAPNVGVAWNPGEARRLARHAARQGGLSRQLRRELLRRRADQLPDRRRQRPRPEPDAGAAAVHARDR